jgi:methionyl-tRNA formyltransferase
MITPANMNEKDLRIIYMGTPEFAVAPLENLHSKGYNIVAVVTAPDKPSGRGKKIQQSAVKTFALNNNLKLFQPEKLRDETFIREVELLNPDLQIVVAFRMMPELLWSIPKKGTFNLHASLLPDYRGAAPINWVIINGGEESGLTTFMIDADIDTGKILMQKRVPISESDDAGTLHDKLMEEGASLVLETVNNIAGGSLKPIPQDELNKKGVSLKSAPKISKNDCRINWDLEGKDVFNFIRGMSPYPGAYSYLERNEGENILFKFFDASFFREAHGLKPGIVSTDNRNTFNVAVKDGWIGINKIQQAGKKAMPMEQFLRGFSFTTLTDLFS